MTLKHFQGKSLTQKPLLFSPAPSFRLGQASGIPRRSGFSLLLPHLCPYCCLHLEGHPSCLHSLSPSPTEHRVSLQSLSIQLPPMGQIQGKTNPLAPWTFTQICPVENTRLPWQPGWLLSVCPFWSRLWYAFYHCLWLYRYSVTLNSKYNPFGGKLSIYRAPIQGYFHTAFYFMLINALCNRGKKLYFYRWWSWYFRDVRWLVQDP